MIDFEIRIDPKSILSLQSKLSKYRIELSNYSEKALSECAERYYEIVISHMGEYHGGEMIFSDVYWKELSPIWLKEKREKGLVEEIWEATGETKAAVKIFGIENKGIELSIFVGLKGVSQNILEKAMHNEFSAQLPDRFIPPRPLFEPAKREMIYNPLHHDWMISRFKNAVRCALGAVK